jgi:hypothetical protein
LFVQTLVFTFLANPDATGQELTQTAAALGLELTESGLTQRFTKEAATLLQEVLAAALTRGLLADPLDLALLAQFRAVYLEDSTTIALPDALQDVWRGCGNATEQGLAALKLTLRLDLRTGQIAGLSLHDGCTADQKAAAPLTDIGSGALYLADLGFYGLRRLRTVVEQQAYFLTRLHGQTSVFTSDGQRWDDVGALLATIGAQTEVDLDVTLGGGACPARSGRSTAAAPAGRGGAARAHRQRAATRAGGLDALHHQCSAGAVDDPCGAGAGALPLAD